MTFLFSNSKVDVSRVVGRDPVAAPPLSWVAFMRGMTIGFVAATLVLDYSFLSGTLFQRAVYQVHYGAWALSQSLRH